MGSNKRQEQRCTEPMLCRGCWGGGGDGGGRHKEKQTGILWLFWATWLTLSLVLEEEVVKKEEEEEVKEKEEDDEAV